MWFYIKCKFIYPTTSDSQWRKRKLCYGADKKVLSVENFHYYILTIRGPILVWSYVRGSLYSHRFLIPSWSTFRSGLYSEGGHFNKIPLIIFFLSPCNTPLPWYFRTKLLVAACSLLMVTWTVLVSDRKIGFSRFSPPQTVTSVAPRRSSRILAYSAHRLLALSGASLVEKSRRVMLTLWPLGTCITQGHPAPPICVWRVTVLAR